MPASAISLNADLNCVRQTVMGGRVNSRWLQAPATILICKAFSVVEKALFGVVTLSEIGPIWTINQQAKCLKSLASTLAVVGKFRSI